MVPDVLVVRRLHRRREVRRCAGQRHRADHHAGDRAADGTDAGDGQ
jgi:hypothetical protein